LSDHDCSITQNHPEVAIISRKFTKRGVLNVGTWHQAMHANYFQENCSY